MAGKKLTRIDWHDVKTGLGLVPHKMRNDGWHKLNDLCDRILSDKSDIAKEFDPHTLRFAVPCDLCKKTVSIVDTYVTYPDGPTRHYDCHMRHIDNPEAA